MVLCNIERRHPGGVFADARLSKGDWDIAIGVQNIFKARCLTALTSVSCPHSSEWYRIC